MQQSGKGRSRKCVCCNGTGTYYHSKRSLPLNEYYWGVVVKIIGLELGCSKTEVHNLLKERFNLQTKQLPNGLQVLYDASTTDLDNKEFLEYLATIRQFFLDFLNIHIPVPKEVTDTMLEEIGKKYSSLFY